jgi:hypothetical protein
MEFVREGEGNRVECGCCKNQLEFEGAKVKAISNNKIGIKFFVVCSKCGSEVVLTNLAHSVKVATCERCLR